jgi:hypothetical protein
MDDTKSQYPKPDPAASLGEVISLKNQVTWTFD